MPESGWGSKEQRDEQAHSWLEKLINDFEAAKASGKGFNILAAESAGDAVRVLAFSDLDQRIDKLLEGFVLGDTLRGAISNIEWSERLNQPRTRRSREEAEEKFLPFDVEAVRDSCAKFGSHLRPCLDRNYDLAFSSASSDQDQAEVVATQAVFGDVRDVETAMQLLSKLTRDGRTYAALVMATEFYRRDQKTEAEAMEAFMIRGDWTPISLALGISGRNPWQLYPYD